MEERVYFKDADMRTMFFQKVRDAYAVRTWNELAQLVNLHRSHFQEYQHGKYTLPKSLFNSCLEKLSLNNQQLFLQQISKKPGNWGCSLGGKITYAKYPKLFEKGRKAAVKARLSKLKYNFDLNFPLSEELCEFIGAFIGDGFTNKYSRHYFIEFAGDSRFDKDYLLNYIGKYANKLFMGLSPSICYRKNQNGMYLRFHSKRLFQLLTERFKLPRGKKCYSVKIPEEILSADNKFISATIRGIFDTDGCVFFDKRTIYRKPYVRMELQMINPPVIKQVHKCLSKLGIKSKILRCGTRLQIIGRDSVIDYLKKIGFSNQRHLDRISKYAPELIKFNKTDGIG